MFSSAVSSILASTKKFYLWYAKISKPGNTSWFIFLCSHSGYFSVLTTIAQECCTSSKTPELCWGTSSSHGLWASWDLEPTINSTQDSNSSILTFLPSKRKKKKEKTFTLQVKRTTTNSCSCTGQKKNFCLAAFHSLGASHTLKGCWVQTEEFGFPSECKAIFITPPP